MTLNQNLFLYFVWMWFMESWFNYTRTFYTAWKKPIRPICKLPYKTHCNFLQVINHPLSIDVMPEQGCIKFIWTLLHSPNIFVKSVIQSFISHYSTKGENFRYLRYKYDLSPTLWISQFSILTSTKMSQMFNTFVQ